MCAQSMPSNNMISEQKESTSNESSDLKALLGEETVVEVKNEVNEVKEEVESKPVSVKKDKIESFLDAPDGYYTINITTTNGLDQARDYISNNNLDTTNSYVFPFGPEMKSAKVLYGIYRSVKEANIAMKSLSSSAIANKPYVDNIAKHQKLYSKYNK